MCRNEHHPVSVSERGYQHLGIELSLLSGRTTMLYTVVLGLAGIKEDGLPPSSGLR
jgi:hypothetical protein